MDSLLLMDLLLDKMVIPHHLNLWFLLYNLPSIIPTQTQLLGVLSLCLLHQVNQFLLLLASLQLFAQLIARQEVSLVKAAQDIP